MTPKQKVLSKHPNAVCEHNGDLGYEIYLLGKFGKTVKRLGGHYYHRRGAWKDAADKLKDKP